MRELNCVPSARIDARVAGGVRELVDRRLQPEKSESARLPTKLPPRFRLPIVDPSSHKQATRNALTPEQR